MPHQAISRPNDNRILENFVKSVCYWLAALCLGYSGVASAFTPANGLWGINAELNGSPGRGFQIEVENETVVLTYYGYRPDGSSAFFSPPAR